MNWPAIGVLRGPNVWARCPVLEVEVDLHGAAADASRVAAAIDRLRASLPDLAEGTDAPDFARALQRLTLRLQQKSGSPVAAGAVRPAGRPGVFRVVAEFEEESLGVACLEAARRLCLAALRGERPDFEAELAPLTELAHEVRLGPSTAAIVSAARRRGISSRRLNDGNLVQLGQGARQRRAWTAETDRTGAIAEVVAQDKDLTRALLGGAGVPVPRGRPVRDADDAWAAAEELGPPVVVKPRHGNHGRGVTTNLTTRDQVIRAFAAAREHEDEVVVERFVPGSDFRLLVVGGHLVAAALREPPQVVGDGRSTVAELVAELNRDPRRSDGHATALSIVKLDAIALAVLAEQGHAPDSVPVRGERVLIRRNANLSSGGTATDVTDRVHPRTAAGAVAAARAVGLDIAGVDVVAPRIDQPLEESGGAVVEVNAGPGLRMHLEPSAGSPRPVGEAIVDLLFPDKADTGRVPIVAVMGANAATAAASIARLLAHAGHHVGLACADGTSVGGLRSEARDGSGPPGARALLMHPRVTAAVLEVDAAGVLREGLGFDLCDVAVLTGIGAAEDVAEAARVLLEAVAPAGAAVADAAEVVVAMAAASRSRAFLFARQENEVVRLLLRTRGGRAVLAREGRIVLAEGAEEQELSPLEGVQGPVEAALAAAAAGWALGLPCGTIRDGLAGGAGGREIFSAAERTVFPAV